jgi:hypothetical protein
MDFRAQYLKRYLRDVRGDDQTDLFRFSLKSLSDRIQYAEYHLEEVKRLMAPYSSGRGPQPGDKLRPFRTALTQSAAHALACLQCLHSCADICAHVVYFGLSSNLEHNPIDERNVGIATVLKRIPAHPVSLALRKLVTHPEFEYLVEVVNRSKHKSVISIHYTLSTEGEAGAPIWHGIVFGRFERLQKSHPARRAVEFLSTELERQKSALAEVTATLEETLLAEWSEQKRIHRARGDRWPPPRIPEPRPDD